MKRYNPEHIDPNGFPAVMESDEDGAFVKLQDVVEWMHTQEESSGRAMAINLVFDATAGSTDDSEDWALQKDLRNKGYGK